MFKGLKRSFLDGQSLEAPQQQQQSSSKQKGSAGVDGEENIVPGIAVGPAKNLGLVDPSTPDGCDMACCSPLPGAAPIDERQFVICGRDAFNRAMAEGKTPDAADKTFEFFEAFKNQECLDIWHNDFSATNFVTGGDLIDKQDFSSEISRFMTYTALLYNEFVSLCQSNKFAEDFMPAPALKLPKAHKRNKALRRALLMFLKLHEEQRKLFLDIFNAAPSVVRFRPLGRRLVG